MRGVRVSSAVPLVSLLAGLLVLSACPSELADRWPAELAVVWTDAAGKQHTDRAATVDFGSVLVGERTTRTLVIKNTGKRESLSLTGLTVTSGEASQVALRAEAEDALFHVPLALTGTLAPGQERQVEVAFTAPESISGQVLDFSVQLTLTAGGTREGEDTALITLQGQAVSRDCAPPAVIDLGTVGRGDEFRMELVLTNPTSERLTFAITGTSSSDLEAFAFELEDGTRTTSVPVPAGGRVPAQLVFSPLEGRSYSATVPLRASESCPALPVTLMGKGVDMVLTWRVDNAERCQTRDAVGVCQDFFMQCGPITPDSGVVERTLTFVNAGSKEVEVTNLSFSRNTTEFFVVGEVGVGTENPLVVPARTEDGPGEANVTLGCQRSARGSITSILTGNTNLPSQNPFGHVQAFAGGGASPNLSVTPSLTLDFGAVAYFAAAVEPTVLERRLAVSNTGTLGTDPADNLHIRAVEIAEAEGTEAGTFSVELAPGSVLPPEGLRPVAGSNQVKYLVRMTPKGLGQKAATLTFVSNDPNSPRTEVQLKAEARELPACAYVLGPQDMGDFGEVKPGEGKNITFTFTNLSSNPEDVCLVGPMQLGASSHTAFSLPAGNQPGTVEVKGGESLEVAVRASVPQGITPGHVLEGTVELSVSSPDTPHLTVPLSVKVAE